MIRLHAMSESPRVYVIRRRNRASVSSSCKESVMRRVASMPIASAAGLRGPFVGHQATMGVSGSSRGVTTEAR